MAMQGQPLGSCYHMIQYMVKASHNKQKTRSNFHHTTVWWKYYTISMFLATISILK